MRIITLLSFLLLTVPGWAQEPPDDLAMQVMRPQDVARVAQPLALTDAQQTRLRELVVGHTREIIKLRGALELQRFELEILMDAPGTDPVRATTQAEAVSALRGALEMEQVKLALDVKSVLTPEQQRKLLETRRGPGGPGGPGGPWGPRGRMGPGTPGGRPGPGGPGGPPPMEP